MRTRRGSRPPTTPGSWRRTCPGCSTSWPIYCRTPNSTRTALAASATSFSVKWRRLRGKLRKSFLTICMQRPFSTLLWFELYLDLLRILRQLQTIISRTIYKRTTWHPEWSLLLLEL